MTKFSDYENLIQIHDGDNSRVYRARRIEDQQPVILKTPKEEYPVPDQLRRYQQEYQLIQRLQLSKVIKAYGLEIWQRKPVIIFEDFGGMALKQWLKQYPQGLPIDLFLLLSIKITNALGQLHSQAVIHKDINPTNIVLNPETMVLKLIDLGISTLLSSKNPSLPPPAALEGTLPYLSPEQTGQINRELDYRTDFYSLGVTFYELLTGTLPFNSDNPIELVHCHIAKEPPPLLQVIGRRVPAILSEVVNKLMAKDAEKRYQNAWELKVDLETCLAQWAATETIAEILPSKNIVSKQDSDRSTSAIEFSTYRMFLRNFLQDAETADSFSCLTYQLELLTNAQSVCAHTCLAGQYLAATGGVATIAADFYFYASLIVLAMMSSDEAEFEAQQQQVQENQVKLRDWAEYMPKTYQHKWQMVEAERCRVSGQKLAAIELYEQAIAGAKNHEYLQDEALANELAARFYLDWGKDKIAQVYFQEAHDCYLQWGATAKVHQLETEYPQFFTAQRSHSSPKIWADYSRKLEQEVNQLTTEIVQINLQLEQEIQKREQAEIALRSSQEQLRLITDSVPAGIAYVDAERRYRFVNKAYEDRFNRPRETILGKYVWEIIGQDTYNSVKDKIDQVLQGESLMVEFDITYESGNTSYITTILRPDFDQSNTVVGYYLIFFDITERRRLEESLKKANDELARLVTVDGLTQIANRRRFDDYLAIEWQRHKREQQPLALILIDIDYFKRYNDHYGHVSGDECLRQVAQTLAKIPQRSADLVARYGGEEFAVILPNTNLDGGLMIAKAMQQAIAELAIPHAQSEVSSHITLSLGVAVLMPTPETDPNDLIARADVALYIAKDQGRDRAVPY